MMLIMDNSEILETFLLPTIRLSKIDDELYEKQLLI